jgi:Holliday junction resolvase RusA-like endonuclease
MMRQEVTAFEKDVPLSIVIAFVKKGKLTGKGDIDNYVKAVLDSLNGVAYYDDSQIVKLFAAKVNPRDGEPIGVAIRIQEVREKG